MMRVRIINNVHYTEYVDIEVKDEDELSEMYENSFDNLSEVDWIHGRDYGDTRHEILDEEDNDESKIK
tara:strand:+ start:74 stop:277 length:204 start_codon:yes stop_codon:yes gene_type:complete